METNSTQAVTPTSTTPEPSVKRHKRGDVREDGMVFWKYGPSYKDGERWVTAEDFAAKQAAEKAEQAKRKANLSAKKAALPTKLHRGDLREDGMVFWAYSASSVNGEYWMPPEKFAAEKAKEVKGRSDLATVKAALPTKRRCGELRKDGMVFCRYNSGHPNGEYWVSSEQFATKKAGQAKKKADLSAKKAALTTKLRRGDVRKDGKIFWAYSVCSAGGEQWITKEKFEQKQSLRKIRGVKYRKDNADKIKRYEETNRAKRNVQQKARRVTHPLYAIKCRLRCRVVSFLKSKGLRKNTKTAAMLGCTYEEFKAHIERLFLPGMSWVNFSDCHIDHIVPLDAADTEADVYSLNHFTNLRPMWGPDNIAKSDTLPEEHELPENLHTKVKEIYLTAKNASAR